MKMKTADLIGAALDWAVMKCEGLEPTIEPDGYLHVGNVQWRPSINWQDGGPIIEQTKMTLDYFGDGSYKDGGMWMATYFIDTPHGTHMDACEQEGPTALIAAMRCYVANKLGDEIEIPEELTK